jgi:hypothetical protein
MLREAVEIIKGNIVEIIVAENAEATPSGHIQDLKCLIL